MRDGQVTITNQLVPVLGDSSCTVMLGSDAVPSSSSAGKDPAAEPSSASEDDALQQIAAEHCALHRTATAGNSAEGKAPVRCSLPSRGVTLPVCVRAGGQRLGEENGESSVSEPARHQRGSRSVQSALRRTPEFCTRETAE